MVNKLQYINQATTIWHVYFSRSVSFCVQNPAGNLYYSKRCPSDHFISTNKIRLYKDNIGLSSFSGLWFI